MAVYSVKRSLHKSGVKIFGPVDGIGQPLPGAGLQKLVFNKCNGDIATADLISGQYYELTARLYGDRGTVLELTTKSDASDIFQHWCSFEIPNSFGTSPTHVGYFLAGSILAKIS